MTHSGGHLADENAFRFSSKHLDAESGLSYYGFRYYDAEKGRWLSKDPFAEYGGHNLYSFVGNEPASSHDGLGRWKAPQHISNTAWGFAQALVETGLDAEIPVFGDISDEIYGMLKGANLWQDMPIFGELGDHRRHYGVTQGGTTPTLMERIMSDVEYTLYLDEERAKFQQALDSPTWKNCKKALKALGRESHSWQDFFAHAIRMDAGGPTNPSGGSENSSKPGFSAWRVGVTGTPDATGVFWPCTWTLFGFLPGIAEGEHPPILEPVDPWSLEGILRIQAGRSFTKEKFKIHLPNWWNVCRCWAISKWGPEEVVEE